MGYLPVPPRRLLPAGSDSKLQGYLLWGLSSLIGISTFYPLAWLYTEHLWHENLGYTDVFWGLHKIRWGFFALCFIVAAGFMNINAAIANILCPESREFRRWTHTQTFSFHRTVIGITIVLGLLMATPMLLLDDIALRFLHQPDSAVAAVAGEPDVAAPDSKAEAEVVPAEDGLHFGKNRNFYLFSYPMHKWLSLWVQILLWVTCIVVGLLYNFYYRRDAHTMARVKRHIVFHGTALWLLLLLVNGWASYVNLWDKVYTKPLTQQISSLHGLFYVDFRFAGATKIYCGVLVGIAVVIVFNIFWRRRLLWYVTAGMWGLSYVLLIHVYPIGVYLTDARIDVPLKEKPYLKRHIEETQKAFELDTIEIVTYKQKQESATLETITENDEIKKNIQIWDRRVLYEALREEQIKTHYNFHPYTDVDRYMVDGEYRQVLIAAREVDPEDVTGWDELKLKYTHGYGVCMSPVNLFVKDGYPDFWVSGIPIESRPGLKVKRPHIYYGEMTSDYVIVKTERQLTDNAAATDTNAANLNRDAAATNTHMNEVDIAAIKAAEALQDQYSSDGGIPLGGWFRRFCFALRFDFFRVLSSKSLTPESRIMFRRKIGTRGHDTRLIRDRVSHIAPFLNYDPDPYIVINNGDLYWIIDFYVTSRYHPNAQMYTDDTARLTEDSEALYAEPNFDKFNYIRNSGVAVVNAYTGKVNFYAVKEDEEVMQTYQKAFPNLFKTLKQMPEGLAAHLRYPDYLTRIQAKMYGDYHQTASQFISKENRWSIPKEAYYSSKVDQEMMPYYAMIKLPGEDKVEFVNMIPLTPPKREKQLKAWMVARCDVPNYGERIIYVLSENSGIAGLTQVGVAGPTRVEEDINKEIGGLQRDWRENSDVIRGNLQIIPIDGALFYVEAIYLQAKKPEDQEDDKPRRPKLQMIVVKAGSNELAAVDKAKTFDQVLEVLLLGLPTNGETAANGEKPPTLAELFKQYEHIDAESDAEKRKISKQILKLLEAQGDQ